MRKREGERRQMGGGGGTTSLRHTFHRKKNIFEMAVSSAFCPWFLMLLHAQNATALKVSSPLCFAPLLDVKSSITLPSRLQGLPVKAKGIHVTAAWSSLCFRLRRGGQAPPFRFQTMTRAREGGRDAYRFIMQLCSGFSTGLKSKPQLPANEQRCRQWPLEKPRKVHSLSGINGIWGSYYRKAR